MIKKACAVFTFLLVTTPAWAGLIEKQGKGVFFFNVAVALIIVGMGGYIIWKKKQADEGDDE